MDCINIKGKIYNFENPHVMGILNFTPDSFNKQSRISGNNEIESRIDKMFADGADIVDIGGMSTRPNCEIINIEEEWKRLLPALKIISKTFPDKIFSIDTFRSEIANRAVKDYGIAIINDISSGEFDKKMFETVADCNVPYIAMHTNGDLQSMHTNTHYKKFPNDILIFFAQKINELHALGVHDVIIDPGFGFSKTIDQNYELLNKLEDFKVFELPLLVGISRKSMIWKYLGIEISEAINGTSVINTIAIQKGANILRVHDVKEAVEVVKLAKKAGIINREIR